MLSGVLCLIRCLVMLVLGSVLSDVCIRHWVSGMLYVCYNDFSETGVRHCAYLCVCLRHIISSSFCW